MRIRPIKSLFNLYFDVVSKKASVKPIETLQTPPKTFLVISNTALGDTILSTPAMKSLKNAFPDSKIVALIHKNYMPLFEGLPFIDTIIPFYGGYRKIFQTIQQIKKHQPEIALIFHGNAPFDIQISVLSGCQYILKPPTKTHLKKFLSYDFMKKDQHIIETRMDLVRLIGAKNIDTSMEISPLDNAELKEKFKKYTGYVGFQIGAANRYKEWAIENFIELAHCLKEENILITGVKQEWDMAEKIAQVCPNVTNLCGACSITELPYLIDRLKVLVTNDTGPMHLAIALDTPTIALFSPIIYPQEFGPYQNSHLHRVIHHKIPNEDEIRKIPKKKISSDIMRTISVEEVFDAYQDLTAQLQQKRKSGEEESA